MNRFLRRVSFTHDVIIVGRGLAGLVLSEALAARGSHVLIIDTPRPGRASHVAAGLVNPVSMRRTVPVWRAAEMLATARSFYQNLGVVYGTTFWHDLSLAELFPNSAEADRWQANVRREELARFIRGGVPADLPTSGVNAPFGHGVVHPCAWLDVRTLLHHHHLRWSGAGRFMEQEVSRSEVALEEHGVRIGEVSAPLLVWCTGAFSQPPGLVPVKGEGLTITAPGLQLGVALHRRVFLLPEGGHRFKVGATFTWNDVWNGPTDEARRWLTQSASAMTQAPVQVEEHWCGVRPAARDRRPLLGRISAYEAVMNGLGARGVLLAPWSANHLADHLLDGLPLDPEVAISRFM